MPHDARAEDVRFAELIVRAMERDAQALLEAFPTPPGTEPMTSGAAALARFDQMDSAQREALLRSRPTMLRELMEQMAKRNGAFPVGGR